VVNEPTNNVEFEQEMDWQMTPISATSKKFQKGHYTIGLALLTTVALAACGGGDSASSTAPTLDLNAAQKAYVTGGFSQSGEISG
jgi:hypothetical protein